MALARCPLVIQDESGNIIDGAQITVQEETGGFPLAIPYSDRDGSSGLGNPFTASDGADAGFYVVGGAYRITATKDSFTRIWRHVAIGTAQEHDAGDFASTVNGVSVSGGAVTIDAGDIPYSDGNSPTVYDTVQEAIDGLFGGDLTDGAFSLTGDLTPSQITSNQNNYDPNGLATASSLRLSTDASRDITGIARGSDGRILLIHNIGSQNIVLKDESGSSTAANRFALNGDVTIAPDVSVELQYDSTSSRWRCVALPPGGVAATQADQEAASSTSAFVSPGRQQFHPSAAKAWVSYDPVAPSLTGSYNVSSVTDTGTGDMTVNFTTSFSGASQYAACVVHESGSGAPTDGRQNAIVCRNASRATGSCRFHGYNQASGAATDPPFYLIAFFGDQ